MPVPPLPVEDPDPQEVALHLLAVEVVAIPESWSVGKPAKQHLVQERLTLRLVGRDVALELFRVDGVHPGEDEVLDLRAVQFDRRARLRANGEGRERQPGSHQRPRPPAEGTNHQGA
jgi:hypothetical protein